MNHSLRSVRLQLGDSTKSIVEYVKGLSVSECWQILGMVSLEQQATLKNTMEETRRQTTGITEEALLRAAATKALLYMKRYSIDGEPIINQTPASKSADAYVPNNQQPNLDQPRHR